MNFSSANEQIFAKLPARFAKAADAASVLQDLQKRSPELAELARTVLQSQIPKKQQAALEQLALLVTPLEPMEYASQKQMVVP